MKRNSEEPHVFLVAAVRRRRRAPVLCPQLTRLLPPQIPEIPRCVYSVFIRPKTWHPLPQVAISTTSHRT